MKSFDGRVPLSVCLGLVMGILLVSTGSAEVLPNRVPLASLRQTCVRAGIALPQILDGGPWLKHPGDRKTQYYDAEARYRPMPAECHGRFKRIVWIKFQIQNPTNHAQWIDAGHFVEPRRDWDEWEKATEEVERRQEERGKSCEKPIPGGTVFVCRAPTKITDEGGIGQASFRGPPPRLHRPRFSRTDPRVYRCTPGTGVTRVRALLKSLVMAIDTGRPARPRVAVVPVRVKSYPGKGPMPRAFAGALRGPC